MANQPLAQFRICRAQEGPDLRYSDGVLQRQPRRLGATAMDHSRPTQGYSCESLSLDSSRPVAGSLGRLDYLGTSHRQVARRTWNDADVGQERLDRILGP